MSRRFHSMQSVLKRWARSLAVSKIPLFWALTVPFMLQVVGVVGLVGYLSYRVEQQTIEELAQELTNKTSQQVTQELDRYLQKAHNANRRHIAALKAGVITPNDLDQLHRYLILQHQQTEELTTLLFATPQGDLRVSHQVSPRDYGVATHLKPEELPFEAAVSKASDPATNRTYGITTDGHVGRYLETIQNLDGRKRLWYQKAVKTGTAGWTDPYQLGATDLLTLNAYAPVYDKTYRLLGVFAVNISLHQLSDFLQQLAVGKTGQVFIVDRKGLLMADSTPETVYQTAGQPNLSGTTKPGTIEFRRYSPQDSANPAIQQSYHYLQRNFQNLATLKSPQTFNFRGKGQGGQGDDRYFVTANPYRDSYGLDWLIVTVVPESDFITQIQTNILQTALLCGATLVGTICLGFWLARRLGRTLQQFAKANQAVAGGDRDQTLPKSRILELDNLSTAFNQMVADLRWGDRLRQQYAQDLAQQVAERTAALNQAQALAHLGSWEFDLATQRITWSDELFRIYGMEPVELAPTCAEFQQKVHPDDWPALEQAIAAAIAHQTPYTVEYRIYRPDGTMRYLMGYGEVLMNAEGQVIKLVGTGQDITDRKLAQIALQASRQQLCEVLDSAIAGIIKLRFYPDTSIQYDYISRHCERTFGYTVEELMPSDALWRSRIHPEDWQMVLTPTFQQILAQREGTATYRMEYRFRRKDESIGWILADCLVTRNEMGGYWDVTVVDTDITDRKQVERQLHESQERYRAIFNQAAVGINQADASGKYISVNRAFCEMLGYTEAELLQVSFQDLTHPDDWAASRAALQTLMQGEGNTIFLEKRYRHKAGHYLWAEVAVSALRDVNGQILGDIAVVVDIHERKQAEASLQKANQDMEAIFTAFPDLLFRLAADGTIQDYKSRKAEDLYTSPTVFRGRKVQEIMPPDVGDRAYQSIQQALASQHEVVNLEYTLPMPDGLRVYDARMVALDERSVVAVVRDVTDRKQAELALQAKTDELDRFFSVALDLFCIANTQGYFLRLNPQWERVLGYPLQELEGARFLDFVHPDDLESTLAAIAVLQAQQEISSFVNRYRCRDGSYRWVEWRSAPIGDLIYAAARDISDRKQAEAKLHTSEATNRAILAAIPDLLLRVGRDGSCHSFFPPNIPGAGQFLPIQAHISEVLSPDLVQHQLNRMEQALATGELQVWEHQVMKYGELCYEEVRLVPCGPDECLVIVRDVTERKQVEQELLRAKDAAESANRAKSAFIATMSHELRTPLNIILGFTSLTMQDTSLPSHHQENLKTVYNSGEHLLRLINSVLDLARIEAGKLDLVVEPVHLPHLLDSLYLMLEHSAQRKGLVLRFDPTPLPLTHILVDRQKLQQVLINLLGNAIKFTAQGNIQLLVSAGQPYRSWGKEPEQLYPLTFQVVDTGIGIAPENLERIFAAFVQVADDRQFQEGTGLGLAISQQLVNLMGGELIATSTLGQGSTFQFTIPVKLTPDAPPVSEPTNQVVMGLAPGQPSYRLLVVDDQPENRRLLHHFLHPLGLEILEAADGEAAIAQWQQFHPHLIWMDLRMPRLDGYEATRRIRALESSPKFNPQPPNDQMALAPLSQQLMTKDKRTKIIALTAQASPEDHDRALAAGCDDYLSKPFTRSTLLTKLAEQLDLRYTYATKSAPVEPAAATIVLTPEDFAIMPREWVASLHQTVMTCNSQLIEKLLQEIPPDASSLASSLQDLVYRFEFEQIMNLAQAHLEQFS